MGRRQILYFAPQPPSMCVSKHVCVCAIKEGVQGVGGSFQNDMYGSDSHLFRGSFQTVETMLLHFATIVPV